jgi:hypothetical protein
LVENHTALKTDDVFKLSIPVEEGVYVLRKVYAFKNGRAAVKDIGLTYRAFDSPVIHSFHVRKILEKGIAEVLLNASDTSGVAEALLELNGRNVSMREEDGLYSYTVNLGVYPMALTVKVYVKDPFN